MAKFLAEIMPILTLQRKLVFPNNTVVVFQLHQIMMTFALCSITLGKAFTFAKKLKHMRIQTILPGLLSLHGFITLRGMTHE